MKGIITLLVLLLAAWMAGAEYVWLCQVKDHCGNEADSLSSTPGASADSDKSIAATDTSAANRPLQTPAAQPDQPSDNTDSAADRLSAADQPAVASNSQATPVAAPSVAAEPTILPDRAAKLVLDGGQTLQLPALGFKLNQWQLNSTDAGADAAAALAEFLVAHPAVDIVVTGQYLAIETSPPGQDDIGLARAAAVRQAMDRLGISRDRVALDSSRISPGEQRPGITLSGLDFSALTQPFIVYFDSGAVAPVPSAGLRAYAGEVDQFLRDHRGASLRVTGHTDNTGESGNNETLSLRRARQVAEQLGELGLPTTRLRLGSEGQNRPVADNNTAAGRAANRRVEIQLDMGRR